MAYRELDETFRLSEVAGRPIAEGRIGKNKQQALVALLRQRIYSRLADRTIVGPPSTDDALSEDLRSGRRPVKMGESVARPRSRVGMPNDQWEIPD